MEGFDAYLFDMDGTLWDAVDSYCEVWNRTIADCGIEAEPVTRVHLETLMGKHLTEICHALIGPVADSAAFMERLDYNERKMMPILGGRLYEGVRAVLAELGKHARLFMISNCQETGLPTFVEYNALGGVFSDLLSYGSTGCEKSENIKRVVERYNLIKPLYIGDTMGDLISAHAAGVPFAWASYGFGRGVTGYEYKLDNIYDLLKCLPSKIAPK